MKITAEEMFKYKRSHWKIENNLHHVLDDAFREDRSTATHSKYNLSLDNSKLVVFSVATL